MLDVSQLIKLSSDVQSNPGPELCKSASKEFDNDNHIVLGLTQQRPVLQRIVYIR